MCFSEVSPRPHDTGMVTMCTQAQSDVRLFGKPVSFERRRMGVALANGKDISEARERAKLAASLVRSVNQ